MANERLTILKRPRSWIVIRPMTLPGFLSAWLRLVGHVIYHSLDIVAFMLGAAVGVTQGLFFCTAPEPLKSPFRKLKPSPPRVTATAISAPPLAPKHLFGAPYDGLVDENYHNEALDPADFVGPGPIEEFSTATKGREHTSSPVEQKKHTEKSQEEEEIEEASEMAAEYAAALAGFTGAERIVHRASKQQPRSVTEAIQAAPDETIEPEAVSAPATETDHLKETGGEVLVQRPAPVVATRAEVPEESKQLKNMSIAAAAVEEMGRKEQEGIGTSALPVVMPIRVQAERISSQPFLKAVEAPSHETAAPEEVEKLEEEKESAAAAAVPLKKSEAVHPSKIPLHKDTHPSAIPLATTLAIAEAAAKEKEKEKEHAAVAAPIIEEVEEEHLPTTPTTPTTAVLVIEEEVFITESASLMTGVVRRSHEASPPAKLPPIAAAPAPAPAPRVQHPTETEEITTSEATTPSSSVSTSGSTPTKQQQKQQKQKKGRGRIRGPLHKIAKEIRKAVQSPVD